jgi:hypothetical protein
MATTAQRAKLHELMTFLLAHEPAVHYAQRRPMRTAAMSESSFRYHVEHEGVAMDCSETVYLLLRLAGLNVHTAGYLAGGYGNSHTLWASLPHYTSPKGTKVGAVVTYGPYGGVHAAIVMDDAGTSDPWLFSMGSEGGPRRVRWSVENAVHGGTATLCSIAHL